MSETKPKIKHDWYQTETDVVITVLIKNVKPEEVKINYGERTLSLTVKQSASDYSLELDLAHKIRPEQCSYKILSTKIEIKLKKDEGLRWTELEGAFDENAPKPIPQSIIDASGPAKVPKYPSSHKKAVDWDELEKKLIEEEKKEEPNSEEALNKLFQDIYGKGSDEVKKAMNKSFLESGGTVLSTNWKDVGDGTVDVKPPDGMEFKKWES